MTSTLRNPLAATVRCIFLVSLFVGLPLKHAISTTNISMFLKNNRQGMKKKKESNETSPRMKDSAKRDVTTTQTFLIETINANGCLKKTKRGNHMDEYISCPERRSSHGKQCRC
jgi:hypothetical protein